MSELNHERVDEGGESVITEIDLAVLRSDRASGKCKVVSGDSGEGFVIVGEPVDIDLYIVVGDAEEWLERWEVAEVKSGIPNRSSERSGIGGVDGVVNLLIERREYLVLESTAHLLLDCALNEVNEGLEDAAGKVDVEFIEADFFLLEHQVPVLLIPHYRN